MEMEEYLGEGDGDVCGGAGWRWKNTLVKVMGMSVVMVTMEMEEYLGEGDGDVCGDDDDGVGSIPW